VHNVVVGSLFAVSLVGLTLAVLASRRHRAHTLWLQLAVGATVGGIAGAVVVAFRTDLVPDEFEIAMAVALVILAAAGIVPLILNRAR
jgi:hypothetical protein